MAGYDAFLVEYDMVKTYSSTNERLPEGLPGFVAPGGGAPPIVDYFKMIGIASGNHVAWVVTGSPDFAGTSYGGPGVLDLATISVSDTWQV